MTDQKLTAAFRLLKITRPKPFTACEAYLAVFHSAHRPDVVIGAATLDDLAVRWEQFTQTPLKVERVQRVVITDWKDTDG